MKLKSPTRRSWIFRAAIVSFLLVSSGIPVAAQVDPSPTTRSAESSAIQHIVYRAAGDLAISWQAATHSDDVVFRVYRRNGLADFELQYELPATPGSAAYRVGASAQAGTQIYELRVAPRDDQITDEVTLGTVEVRVSEWQDSESTLSMQRSQLGELGASAFGFAAPQARIPAEAPTSTTARSLRPPTPPPRLV